VREVNRFDRLEDELKNYPYLIDNTKLDKFHIKKNCFNLLVSNSPKLTLINVCQMLKKTPGCSTESSSIFVKLETLMNDIFLPKVERAKSLNPDRFLVVDCSENFMTVGTLEHLKKSFRSLNNSIFVCKNTVMFENVVNQEIEHVFDDLSDNSKMFLMTQDIQFQGVVMMLKELLNENEVAEIIHLNDLLFKPKDIGPEIPETLEVHIEREVCFEVLKVKKRMESNFESPHEFEYRFKKSEQKQQGEIVSVSMRSDELLKHVENRVFVWLIMFG
jgi:hypothetical protein